MDAPRYAMSNEPADEREALQRLRAELRTVTDHLDDLLNVGFPRKGRNTDDKEAWQAWHEDRHEAVRRAYEALEQTAAFSASQSGNAPRPGG